MSEPSQEDQDRALDLVERFAHRQATPDEHVKWLVDQIAAERADAKHEALKSLEEAERSLRSLTTYAAHVCQLLALAVNGIKQHGTPKYLHLVDDGRWFERAQKALDLGTQKGLTP